MGYAALYLKQNRQTVSRGEQFGNELSEEWIRYYTRFHEMSETQRNESLDLMDAIEEKYKGLPDEERAKALEIFERTVNSLKGKG